MKDINGILIKEGSLLEDLDGRRYCVVTLDGNLYAKSLFSESGCGDYLLYKERVIRNGFKVVGGS